MTSTQPRIAALDGWRAISVVLVIFCHLTTYSSIKLNISSDIGRAIVAPFLNASGSLGVSIFFVISGYVITGGLIREYARNDRISLFRFYLRRAFRILPPLLMYVLVTMALARANTIPREAFGVVKALTFTCNFGAGCGAWFGGHMWSLSYEEQFYLVIPVLFFFLWKSSHLLFFALPAILGLLTLSFCKTDPRLAHFFGHFVAISIGVAWATREKYLLEICGKVPKWVAVLTPIFLAAAARLSYTSYWPIDCIISPLLIMFILVYSTHINTVLSAVLSLSIVAYFGRISYTIYLWQQLATFHFSDAAFKFYIVSVTLCVLWAVASYRWIEAPLIGISHSVGKHFMRPGGAA